MCLNTETQLHSLLDGQMDGHVSGCFSVPLCLCFRNDKFSATKIQLLGKSLYENRDFLLADFG